MHWYWAALIVELFKRRNGAKAELSIDKSTLGAVTK